MTYFEDDRSAHAKIRSVVLPVQITPPVHIEIREFLFQHALQDKSRDINLYCTTYGGDTMEAIAIADAIKATRDILNPDAQINGVVNGYCMSAGTFILQFCDVRRASQNSYIMVHGVTHNKFGPSDESQTKRDIELMQSLRKIWVDTYMARSKKPRSYWEKLMMTNTANYYTAEEALSVGLIDEVISGETFRGTRPSRKRVVSVPERSGVGAVKKIRSPRRKVQGTTETNNS